MPDDIEYIRQEAIYDMGKRGIIRNMNKKTLLVAFLALFLGIGGTAAYFWLHSLYVAHTAPPIPPAAQQQQGAPPAAPPAVQQSPTQQQAAQQPMTQQPPAGQAAPASAATLDSSQLVLARISYGAPIEAVRQNYGEPKEIEQKYKAPFQGSVTV